MVSTPQADYLSFTTFYLLIPSYVRPQTSHNVVVDAELVYNPFLMLYWRRTQNVQFGIFELVLPISRELTVRNAFLLLPFDVFLRNDAKDVKIYGNDGKMAAIIQPPLSYTAVLRYCSSVVTFFIISNRLGFKKISFILFSCGYHSVACKQACVPLHDRATYQGSVHGATKYGAPQHKTYMMREYFKCWQIHNSCIL